MMNFLEERWLRIRETTGIHKYDPKDKPAEREVKGVIFFKKEKKKKKTTCLERKAKKCNLSFHLMVRLQR